MIINHVEIIHDIEGERVIINGVHIPGARLRSTDGRVIIIDIPVNSFSVVNAQPKKNDGFPYISGIGITGLEPDE